MPPLTIPVILWNIAYSAGTGFFTNRLSTSAAAMAFYTMFAIGPIMIFSIALAEPIVGRLLAQEAIFDALSTVVPIVRICSTRSINRMEMTTPASATAMPLRTRAVM